jgi:hypothetical protein
MVKYKWSAAGLESPVDLVHRGLKLRRKVEHRHFSSASHSLEDQIIDLAISDERDPDGVSRKMTSVPRHRRRRNAVKIGMTDYMKKPVVPVQLYPSDPRRPILPLEAQSE